MIALDGKVAWVTGAGSGIGRAAACALAAAGARVVLSGRRAAALDETAATIDQAGGAAVPAPLDVSDLEAVRNAADTIDRRFGRLDLLVNNAGINVAARHWNAGDLGEWNRLVEINVKGVYYCVSAALPIMRRQQDGLIINISSWAGRHSSHVAGVPYGASKHAVMALNASINLEEFRNGIRACAICPGEVATPILDRRPVPVGAEDRAKMLQPEDLAETIVFVARMAPRVCVNEILISPTWNRSFLARPDVPPSRSE
jgi:NADP-dependent 3-hydroxy acid dehydrogenase YdfG